MPATVELNIKDIASQTGHGKVTGTVGDELASWETKPWTLGQLPGITSSTSTALTLSATHEGRLLRINIGTAGTLSIPTDAALEWPIGGRVELMREGAGQITVTALSGVTLTAAGRPKFRVQGSWALLTKIGANAWLLTGDTTV